MSCDPLPLSKPQNMYRYSSSSEKRQENDTRNIYKADKNISVSIFPSLIYGKGLEKHYFFSELISAKLTCSLNCQTWDLKF
jgi:hypothetical protein